MVNDAIDKVFTSNEYGCPLPADEATKLNAPQICVKLASLEGSYEHNCFASQVTENAHVSHAAMAFRSILKDDDTCKIFEARVSEKLATVFAMIQAISAGDQRE